MTISDVERMTEAMVIDRLRALQPELAATAAETERLRRPLDETVAKLEEAGFYLLSRPKRYGGLEASITTRIKAIELIAFGCPSTSWAAAIHLAVGWWMGTLDDRLQEQFWSVPNARAIMVSAPTGKGQRQSDGSVVVNGRWAYATGNAHAHIANLFVMVDEADGSVNPCLVAIPIEDVERIDDWHAFGMAGTGSNTLTVTDCRVLDYHVTSMADPSNIPFASVKEKDNDYYRSSFGAQFNSVGAGTIVGIAEGAIQAFLDRLPGRAITHSRYPNQAEAAITHHQIAEARMRADSVRFHICAVAEMMEAWGTETPPVIERAEIRGHIGYATRTAKEVVEILFQASGSSAIQNGVPIQRFLRDVEAISTQGHLLSTTSLELYGRVLVGLDPDSNWL